MGVKEKRCLNRPEISEYCFKCFAEKGCNFNQKCGNQNSHSTLYDSFIVTHLYC